MREEIYEQLDIVLQEQIGKKSKQKKGKGEKSDKLKKVHNEETLKQLSEMLYRLYNARKIVIYRTTQLLKYQEQKESSRKDKVDYGKRIKETEKDLENRTEKFKNEINTICEYLQLTQEKKKEAMETYNQIIKPYKQLRLPTGF